MGHHHHHSSPPPKPAAPKELAVYNYDPVLTGDQTIHLPDVHAKVINFDPTVEGHVTLDTGILRGTTIHYHPIVEDHGTINTEEIETDKLLMMLDLLQLQLNQQQVVLL